MLISEMSAWDMAERMGTDCTDMDGEEMIAILKSKGIADLDDISDSDFFALIPQACNRAMYRAGNE